MELQPSSSIFSDEELARIKPMKRTDLIIMPKFFDNYIKSSRKQTNQEMIEEIVNKSSTQNDQTENQDLKKIIEWILELDEINTIVRTFACIDALSNGYHVEKTTD